jgi:hypothetical protein
MPLARASASVRHAIDVDDSARQNLGALDGRTDGDLQNLSSKAETILLGHVDDNRLTYWFAHLHLPRGSRVATGGRCPRVFWL